MDSIEKFEREKTFYEILGCSSSASKEQITAEYRHKAKSCHPDKKPDDEDAAKEFKRLQDAYKVLSDDEAKKDYDKWLFSGLSVSYETWKSMMKGSHISMHWGMKKRPELQITNNDSDGNTAVDIKQSEISSVEASTSSSHEEAACKSDQGKVVDKSIPVLNVEVTCSNLPLTNKIYKRRLYFGLGSSKFSKYDKR